MLGIDPIRNNINFCHYKNTVYKKTGDIAYRGDTCLFRCDLDFNMLIKFIEEKYKDIPNVKIIAHACSVGEEVYSFLAILNDMLGENKAKKYLPILARDIDRKHIQMAKDGYYKLMQPERDAINYYLGNKFYNYFDNIDNKFFKNYVRAKDSLKSQVKFKQSDIINDSKDTNYKNTVLFARNFWPYLDPHDAEKLAMNLSKNMDDTSLLVIGNYDLMSGTHLLLDGYGFKKTMVENVYERPIPNPKLADKSYFQALKMFIKKQI